MADSVAGSFAMLSGVEIVNDSRTFAYLNAGIKPGSLTVHGDCGCEHIPELVGHGDYTTPEADNAPWYSPDIPESARFAGFMTTNFDGMGSTFTRTVTDTIGDGGVLGRGRLAHRLLTWRGLLLGADGCAVMYGLRWLARTLATGSDCRDCRGDDLHLLYCCTDLESDVEAFRLLKEVALIDGPNILSERKTGPGCGCPNGNCPNSNIMEIEFTLASAQPYFYASPVPIYDCIGVGAAVPLLTDPDEPCEPEDCNAPLLDTVCPVPTLPPTAGFESSCVTENTNPRALYLTIPRSSWNSLEEVIPVISITNKSSFAVGPINIGFYTSVSGDPCGDLLTSPPLCDAICDRLTIVLLAGGSTFYIDGRTKQMAVFCPDNTIFPGERYTAGPWSWPSFADLGFCLEVVVDEEDAILDKLCVSISLVPRTF